LIAAKILFLKLTMSLNKFSLCIFAALFAFTLTACTTQAQPMPDTPLVRIGKAATAPVIDGSLDDAAWKEGVVAADFALSGSDTPAREATQVRFAYDAANLYVAWRCEESLLVVAQQRMHEVKANAKKPDDDVLSDDSVLLFVQPGGSGAMYEFDVNSIGTLFDARSEKSDLWGARDASWNSGAKAAGAQEDGYWTAELAIPWSALGLNAPPAGGDSWPLGLARHAAGRGESSAWNQSAEAALHKMKNFGALVFGDRVPAVEAQSLPEFEAGRSNFKVRAVPEVKVDVELTGDKKATPFSGGRAAARKDEIAVALTATEPQVLFQWSAKAGDEILYRSPQLQLSAQSTLAHLIISTAQPWKLFLNGALADEGESAQNQDVAFPLADGINDIVVQAQSGQAQLQLSPPGDLPTENVTWRTHAVEPGVLPATDRRSWKLAPQQDGTIGDGGAPALLQHTLLWKATHIYPVSTPAFYIAQGAAQQITFLAEGVPGLRFDDWQMQLAVPPEFEILGSSGFYGNNIKGKPKFTIQRTGDTLIGGEKMALYRISADHPIIHKAKEQTVLVSFEVLARLPQTAKLDTAKQWNFHYWTRANKGAVSEAPQTIAVRALPPLAGKQPKTFIWEFWVGATHVYDDPKLLDEILKTSQQAGFTKYQGASNKEYNDNVRRFNMKPFLLINFKDGRTFDITKPYLKAHPDEALVDKTGARSDVYMCTTQLLGKNWPLFEKSIQDITQTSGAAAIEYDYEFPPFNPPHACFDERCLSEFRRFAKIEGGVELTPAIVQREYSAQWVDFMAHRTALLLKKMQQAVHQADPGVRFTVYSGYYNAEENTTKTRYGIDWNLVGEMQAVDEAGMGYGRPVPAITDSIRALRGIPVKFGELLTPYDKRSRQPVAPLLQAVLLRRALDATGGVLIYARPSMDGRSWQAVADVSRLTADHEAVFLHKTLQEFPGQDAASVQIAKGANEVLLCVMNLSASSEKTFSFTVPATLGAGREYYGGAKIEGGQKLQLKLAPGQAQVFVF
jgi:hypothetical protein